MWLFARVAWASAVQAHPTTGEPHRFVDSGALFFDPIPSPVYPPEALGDRSLPDVVRCTARLWSHADGTVETLELLECPAAFRTLTETALERYTFHDPHAPVREPLVTEVVIDFARPDAEVPVELAIHPVSRASVPILDRMKVLGRKLPRSTSDTPVICTATLFVTPTGRVDAVTVLSTCPWPKPVVKAAMRWTFEPWVLGGTPAAFAVVEGFAVDP